MPITITTTEPLATGASWRAPPDALAQFQPGAQALISFSNLAGLDPAPILDELYRYPYGCTEQLTSVAMPLLYYNVLASEANRQRDPRITRRLQDAVTQILDRQGPDGAIGLWSAGDGHASPWLGAYATDFLLRAQRAGYAVPRKVDRSGTVSVYNRNYYVGKAHAGRAVYVSVDPQRREWIFRDEQGSQVRSQPAEQLCRERIVSLTVTHRR